MDAKNAIATLKSLLKPGTEVLTHVSENRGTGYVLAFVKDKQNPQALIPLNLLIEESGLFDNKLFTKDGYKSKTLGMDRAFEFVYRLEERLYGGFLPNYSSGDMNLRLIQKHHSLGWFQGGESASVANLFLACEFDQWRSSNSRVIQGIFSTEEKAIKALTKLYGKLEKDSNGGELGFVPVNNPDDVTLQVVQATLDEVDEV